MVVFNLFSSEKEDRSLIAITQKAFHLLKLKVTKRTVEDSLLSHPGYPNLASFSHLLTRLQIDYQAIKINEEQLSELALPFFAHLPKYGLVFVNSIDRHTIKYITGISGRISENKQTFCKKWSGIIFTVDTGGAVSEDHYQIKAAIEKLRSYRLLICIILASLLLVLSGIKLGTNALFLTTKVAGLTICSMLAYFDISQNAASSRFCKIGDKINCQSVLSSPAAKVLGTISMADIGLVYFATGLIVVLCHALTIVSTSYFFLLGVTALLALPYTLFSVYYQSFILKKWCTLCLSVIFLLWIEAASFLPYLSEPSLQSLQETDVIIFTSFALIVIIIWSFLKDSLTDRIALTSSKYQLQRLVRQTEIFNVLHSQTPKIDSYFHANHIRVGYPNAENNLLAIINPMCSVCAYKYADAVDLVKNYPDKVNVKFLFYTSSLDMDSLDNRISATIIELFYHVEEEDFIQAVSEWFQHRNLQKLQSKYQVNDCSKQAVKTLTNQFRWLKTTDIKVTPILFFNERKLSKQYSIRDLSTIV